MNIQKLLYKVRGWLRLWCSDVLCWEEMTRSSPSRGAELPEVRNRFAFLPPPSLSIPPPPRKCITQRLHHLTNCTFLPSTISSSDIHFSASEHCRVTATRSRAKWEAASSNPTFYCLFKFYTIQVSRLKRSDKIYFCIQTPLTISLSLSHTAPPTALPGPAQLFWNTLGAMLSIVECHYVLCIQTSEGTKGPPPIPGV